MQGDDEEQHPLYAKKAIADFEGLVETDGIGSLRLMSLKSGYKLPLVRSLQTSRVLFKHLPSTFVCAQKPCPKFLPAPGFVEQPVGLRAQSLDSLWGWV